MKIEKSIIPLAGRETGYPELHELEPTKKGEEGDCVVYSIDDEIKVRSAANYLTRTRGWRFITRSDRSERTFTVWRREDK